MEALEECDLADLGFEGDPFTWRNNSHTSSLYVRERLDRAVANKDWTTRFPLYHTINGEPRHSDHRPVIVNTESPQGGWSGGGGREFRFKPSWVEEENCGVLVENAWKTSVEARGENVGEALKRVASVLGVWGGNVLGRLEKTIKRTKKALEECRRRAISDASVRREELLKLKLEKLEEKKNLY